jgi:hypothetical protein
MDSGRLECLITDVLLDYLMCVPSEMLTPCCFIFVNLDPKDEVSMEFCFLVNQIIGTQLRNMRTPVLECLVTLSPIWLLSTVHKGCHLEFGWAPNGLACLLVARAQC